MPEPRVVHQLNENEKAMIAEFDAEINRLVSEKMGALKTLGRLNGHKGALHYDHEKGVLLDANPMPVELPILKKGKEK